ncbi:proline racemase family protein [Mesorhizobium sp. M0933]|uniref:proline racemase family protein n=1 Tax=Mesorhizobium sp. M0933 TaxID=2957030 RepID=UPI0033365390
MSNSTSYEIPITSSFTAYDCHCEGDVEKVVVSGLPELPEGTAFEKMKFFRDHHDDIRLFFLREPRGSMIQSVNFIVPTENPEAAAAYIIAEAEEYPEMSGGNTISVATTMLKTGMVPITGPITRFKLEAPAGLIGIECDTSDGKVGAVRFINQPAFAYCLNKTIQLPGLGDLIVDVGYGGMTYAIVGAQQFGFDLVASEGRRLSDLGQEIKAAAAAQIPVTHPLNPELPGITQTMFVTPVQRSERGVESKNAVVVSPGRIDRCPCGTGTSARLAVMHAKGEIQVAEQFTHKSLIDSTFIGEIVATTAVGPYNAIIPAVSGRAWITAKCSYILEADDPYPAGYAITDTWPEMKQGLVSVTNRTLA